MHRGIVSAAAAAQEFCRCIVGQLAQPSLMSIARMQVELAQSEYQLPRLTRMWSHLERQSGSGQVRAGVGVGAWGSARHATQPERPLAGAWGVGVGHEAASRHLDCCAAAGNQHATATHAALPLRGPLDVPINVTLLSIPCLALLLPSRRSRAWVRSRSRWIAACSRVAWRGCGGTSTMWV